MTRKESLLVHFERISGTYHKYRSKRKYYWSFISEYFNFFSTEDQSVLDVGCGTGELLNQVKGKRKVGVDFCKGMIDEGKTHYPDMNFIYASAEDFSIDERFDTVIMSNVLGVFDDIQASMMNARNHMHDESKLLITYYNYLWEPLIRFGEFLGVKKKAPEQAWLNTNDITNFIELSGLEVYKNTKDVLLPYNIPLVSWFCNKIVAKLPLINHLCLNNYLWCRKKTSKGEFVTSIVVPARNESGNIEDAILRTPKFGAGIELIFIEGNSTDDTWDVIQEMYHKYKDTHNIKIGRQEGKGKGDAVRKGYSLATGDILMILDADLTVPPEELPKFYDALVSGQGEFINGCRLVYPMEDEAMRPLNVLGNKFFSMAFSWILEMPIKDTLCGTKVLFKKDYIRLAENRAYFGEFDPFGDFDLLFGAYKLNLKIIDLPIRYRKRTYGDTNISRFRHGLILLKMTAYASKKIKFRK